MSVEQMIQEVVVLRKEKKRIEELILHAESRLGWACDQGTSFLAGDVCEAADAVDLPFI